MPAPFLRHRKEPALYIASARNRKWESDVPRTWCVVLAVTVAVAGLAGCSQRRPVRATESAGGWSAGKSSADKGARALLVCNGSTQPCPDVPHYSTVQDAVDAAQPRDWVLIWPGVYHENDPAHHSGVWITTPDLHIRGMSRAGVVIDGSHGTASHPCPSSKRLQSPAHDGIVVWEAGGVTIQNLTVCDYLAGPDGEHGNQIWWDGGEGSGKIGLKGFEGSYLTATSMYHPADIHTPDLAQYGIYVGNAAGPGQITHSYASNMAAGAFYVGACRQVCDTVLSDDHGTSSAIGFLGTNAGGNLVIKDSVFDSNRTGLVISSQNTDDAPPPQNGRCPGSATRSCTMIENNQISGNNNADAPVNGLGPAVGAGIELDGGKYDTVTGNMITDNESWGVIANDIVDMMGHLPYARCQGGYPNVPARKWCLLPARGNQIFGNTLRHDGTFGNPGDAALATIGLTAGSAVPRNCFYANRAIGGPLTSTPVDIEYPAVDGPPCGKPGTGGNQVLLEQLDCSRLTGPCTVPHSTYPRQTRIDFTALPQLPGMPNPCVGVPGNAFCSTGAWTPYP